MATPTTKKLNIAILTVSDTRTAENDTSGHYLVEAIQLEGHTLADRAIVTDNRYKLREIVSRWIADDGIHVVITTGGTGFIGTDTTPEALAILFDQHIEGFGELFRHLSYQEIGTSTVQSRALGGIANKTAIFCLPGSTGACKTGWNGILKEQLDGTHKPCNFVSMLTS